MLQNSHTSQFSFKLPYSVQKTVCGISCIVQTLKFFGITNSSPETVFLEFVTLGKYTRNRLVIKYLDFGSLQVPYATFDNNKIKDGLINEIGINISEKYIVETEPPNSDEYLPTYLMKSGSDARGIKYFLEKKGLKVELVEHSAKVAQATLVTDLNSALNDEKVIIASIKMNLPYLKSHAKEIYGEDTDHLTHLVFLKKENGNIYVVDPLFEVKKAAVHKIDISELLNAMLENRASTHFLAIQK